MYTRLLVVSDVEAKCALVGFDEATYYLSLSLLPSPIDCANVCLSQGDNEQKSEASARLSFDINKAVLVFFAPFSLCALSPMKVKRVQSYSDQVKWDSISLSQ